MRPSACLLSFRSWVHSLFGQDVSNGRSANFDLETSKRIADLCRERPRGCTPPFASADPSSRRRSSRRRIAGWQATWSGSKIARCSHVDKNLQRWHQRPLAAHSETLQPRVLKPHTHEEPKFYASSTPLNPFVNDTPQLVSAELYTVLEHQGSRSRDLKPSFGLS